MWLCDLMVISRQSSVLIHTFDPLWPLICCKSTILLINWIFVIDRLSVNLQFKLNFECFLLVSASVLTPKEIKKRGIYPVQFVMLSTSYRQLELRMTPYRQPELRLPIWSIPEFLSGITCHSEMCVDRLFSVYRMLIC